MVHVDCMKDEQMAVSYPHKNRSTLDNNYCCLNCTGSITGFWEMTTYTVHPSPKSTLTLTSLLGQNADLGEG